MHELLRMKSIQQLAHCRYYFASTLLDVECFDEDFPSSH